MLPKRRKTRQIKLGRVNIGSEASISIQSMCNTKTSDVKSTVKQIHELEQAGCDIVRVAVPDEKSASALKQIKSEINVPLVADIHFDYRLAVKSADYADKLRINPGNIGNIDNIKAVVSAAKDNKIPIRVGINSGSIEKRLLEKHGSTSAAMVESALDSIKKLEELDFHDIIISLKASDVMRTVEAHKLIADKTDVPLHIGITEAGTIYNGTVKSSVAIGALLLQGIGDTIRVSLTADPVEEVKLGKAILKSIGLNKIGPEIISCPTCARSKIDVIKLTKEVEGLTKDIKENVKIAVMGCEVNGPGEAREADIGIAGCADGAVIFKKGEVIKTVSDNDAMTSLSKEIKER